MRLFYVANKTIRRLVKSGFLLFLFAMVFPMANANADTFYVDPQSGNNSNSGLSQTSAWKTIPGTEGDTSWGAINSANRIQVGDIVELMAGATLTSSQGGRLVIDSVYYDNGTSSAPIIIRVSDTWGTGNFTYEGIRGPVRYPADIQYTPIVGQYNR